MPKRVDPVEAIDAQLRDAAQARSECGDLRSAEALRLLWRCDLLLDRRLQLKPCRSKAPA